MTGKRPVKFLANRIASQLLIWKFDVAHGLSKGLKVMLNCGCFSSSSSLTTNFLAFLLLCSEVVSPNEAISDPGKCSRICRQDSICSETCSGLESYHTFGSVTCQLTGISVDKALHENHLRRYSFSWFTFALWLHIEPLKQNNAKQFTDSEWDEPESI